jgi:hypothetical protein
VLTKIIYNDSDPYKNNTYNIDLIAQFIIIEGSVSPLKWAVAD